MQSNRVQEVARILAGWCGWVMERDGGDWKIAVEQINLIDCNLGQENNTFVL